jgi:hypothetical protein
MLGEKAFTEFRKYEREMNRKRRIAAASSRAETQKGPYSSTKEPVALQEYKAECMKAVDWIQGLFVEHSALIRRSADSVDCKNRPIRDDLPPMKEIIVYYNLRPGEHAFIDHLGRESKEGNALLFGDGPVRPFLLFFLGFMILNSSSAILSKHPYRWWLHWDASRRNKLDTQRR